MEAKEASEGEFAESEGVKVKKKMRNYRSNFFRSIDRIAIRFSFCATTVQIMRQLHVRRGFNRSFLFFFSSSPPFFFRWFINEKKVIGDYTTEMIIHNATRDLHDAIVKCEVHNDVGKSEDTETLDITCEYTKKNGGSKNQLF